MFLVVDIDEVLDTSQKGTAAAAFLRKEYEKHKKARDALAKDKRAEYEREATMNLERERARLRQEVLVEVRKLVQALMKEKGAKVVLPRAQTLAYDDKIDVTAEVLRRLNASA